MTATQVSLAYSGLGLTIRTLVDHCSAKPDGQRLAPELLEPLPQYAYDRACTRWLGHGFTPIPRTWFLSQAQQGYEA